MSRVLNSLLARLADYRRRQRAYAELSALDDRALADIGIIRSDIPGIVEGPAEAAVGRPNMRHDLKHAA